MSSNTANTRPQGLVGTLDVLAVIRAPLEQYPPSLHQAGLLAEAGLRVGVVDTWHADYNLSPFSGAHQVERFHLCRHAQLYKEKLPSTAVRVVRAWRFRRGLHALICRRRPRVIIAYDPSAIWAVGRTWRKYSEMRMIWHFHELCIPSTVGGGWFTKRASAFAWGNAERPDLIVFPDRKRAALFAEGTGLKKQTELVMNCPRRLGVVPENRLRARLGEIWDRRLGIVYFHGWIGLSRCLETVIESMKYWPADTLLVLVGPVSQSYRDFLETLAGQTGIRRRVKFLGTVPYSELPHLAVGASVGISLVADTSDANWTYSAGAINKRFEYMAVGLPQIANQGEGMPEILERPECGLLVYPRDPQELGNAVARLLGDASWRQRLGQNARQAHLSEFNYEKQFAPVLSRVLKWCPRRD